MLWKIEFYNNNVEADIKTWPESMIPKLLWQLNFIEKIGPNKIDIPYVKSLGQGLFKMNVKDSIDTGCVLFCISTQNKAIIILDGFIGRAQKIMPNEIMLARNRMSEINLKQL